MTALTYAEIESAAARVGDRIRRVVVAQVDQGMVSTGDAEVFLALEFMQHTGTFKAQGPLGFSSRRIAMLPTSRVTMW